MKKSQSATTTGNGTAPPRLRLKLSTAEDVRRELARLYREARSNQLEVSDASRLANVLQILARCIETGDLERRLQALEEASNGKH